MDFSNIIKFILPLLIYPLFFAACAGPIKGLPDNEEINPAVVYVESCDYNLRGMLAEYVSPAVYLSLEARRHQMPELSGLCVEIMANIESTLEKFGIKAIVKDVNSATAPPKDVRNYAANNIGAKYIIFIHKPVIDNLIQNNLYVPYVYTGVDMFDLNSDKAIGSGEVISGKVAIRENGVMVATKIAETLRKRCSNRYVGCGTDGGIYMFGR
ncbi:hypothetical protein [Paraburkholderia adhaesiva]|uniref:hypothetical protein n=1 Tax=Paraburkholderia adhaesiva TaxID=2883244 RepID=UPI001F427E5E|nr:hypothetical protein [Paraburkholderia adhaesiva]